jgi:hypothetical protein
MVLHARYEKGVTWCIAHHSRIQMTFGVLWVVSKKTKEGPYCNVFHTSQALSICLSVCLFLSLSISISLSVSVSLSLFLCDVM